MGKRHEMPCHHSLEEYLHAYIDGTGIASDPKGALFRTIQRGTGKLSTKPFPQANAYAMVQRRARRPVQHGPTRPHSAVLDASPVRSCSLLHRIHHNPDRPGVLPH